MRRALLLALVPATFWLLVSGLGVYAQITCSVTQTTPGFNTGGSVFGKIAAQWNAYFGSKVDANNGTLCNPTIVGTINLTLNEIVSALGYTPLRPSNNLSDVTSNAAALANLENLQLVTLTGAQAVTGTTTVWQPTTPALTTFTLPASPLLNQRQVFDYEATTGSFALTIAANTGQNILGPNGVVSSINLTTLGQTAVLRYVGANLWVQELGTFSVSLAAGSFNLTGVISPAALVGNQNDWNPTGLQASAIIRIDGGAADRTITGIAAPTTPVDGRNIKLLNIGTTNNLIFPNQSASSTASNRFLFGTDIVLPPGGTLEISYDNTSTFWRGISHVPKGNIWIGRQTFCASGCTATGGVYTPTAGTNLVDATCVGGGGAGGGNTVTAGGQNSGGAGGAAGGGTRKRITASFSGVTVTPGAAGAGVSGATGGAGGNTTFGAILTANGGAGGFVTAANSTPGSSSGVPAGGTATGGDVNVQGGSGFDQIVYVATVGTGADGADAVFGLGFGGKTTVSIGANTNGRAATGFGAGGGGASAGPGTSAGTGGAGSAGICIVDEYH